MLIKSDSNIKVGLEVVVHLLALDLVLGVEDDLLLRVLELQKLKRLLLHVVVQHEKTVVHPSGQVVLFFDVHGLFCLHDVGLTVLASLGLDIQEEIVHLLLFFSSVLHRLQVPSEH